MTCGAPYLVNDMKSKSLAACLLLLGALACAAAATATERIDYGKREYMTTCASCHGERGKGDGPVAEWMRLEPADLTTLAKRNGGVVPTERAYRVVDGRDKVKGHGAPNMPVWGSNFLAEGMAEFAYPNGLPNDLEAHVRNRILSLIGYLKRIQQK